MNLDKHASKFEKYIEIDSVSFLAHFSFKKIGM